MTGSGATGSDRSRLLSRLIGAPARSASPAALPVLLGAPVLAWQLIFFVAPLVFLVVVTFWTVRSFRLEPDFSLDNWSRILNSTPFQRALIYTAEISVICAVLTVAIALPAAYTIAFRLSPRWRDLALTALIVPVFSSYMLRIYAWQIVLSPGGVVNSVLGPLTGELPLLGGQFSLQVGLLTLTLPVATIILAFAFSGVDRTLIEAAENLGCRRSRIIWHVLLPSIRAAIILAGSTAFLLAFGDYISPLFMTGSKPPTLSILIVDTVKSGSQWPRASVIGVCMLAILAAFFLAGAWLGRERRSKGEGA
jgi:ABC-type spermidine/putrescine transport system permease subunit I